MSVYRTRESEFYVGYHEKAPPATGRFVRVVVGVIAVACVVVPLGFTAAQRPFSTATFEFGSLRELSGFVTRDPVPMLRVVVGYAQGEAVVVSLPLLAPGKFGGARVLDAIEKMIDPSIPPVLSQEVATLEVTLRGTLVYHDGKTLFELSEGEETPVSVDVLAEGALPKVKVESLGRTTLRGEIVDSKCYFGVMKPGLGKPHRSCAIRCISGGIPPVLMVRNAEGDADYILVVGPEREPVNERILDYVAIPVEVEGELERFDDWLLIRTDPASGITPVR